MSCDNGDKVQANRGAIGGWEKFYVYTTSDRDGGLAEGRDYLALKSAHFNRFVTNDGGDVVKCNRGAPGLWEKWGGWRDPIPWAVEKIDFNLNAGKV